MLGLDSSPVPRIFRTTDMRFALAFCAALALAGGPAMARPAPDSFADLAAKLLPTVVNIATTQTLKTSGDPGGDQAGPEIPEFPPGSPFEKFFHDFLEHGMPKGSHPDLAPRKATSLGSGFIID